MAEKRTCKADCLERMLAWLQQEHKECESNDD